MWQRPPATSHHPTTTTPNRLATTKKEQQEYKKNRRKKVCGKIVFPAQFGFGWSWISLARHKNLRIAIFSRFNVAPPHTHTHTHTPSNMPPSFGLNVCVWALAASRASACRLLQLFLLARPRVQVPSVPASPLPLTGPALPKFHSSNPERQLVDFCMKFTCKNQTNFALHWRSPVGIRFLFSFFYISFIFCFGSPLYLPLCFVVFVLHGFYSAFFQPYFFRNLGCSNSAKKEINNRFSCNAMLAPFYFFKVSFQCRKFRGLLEDLIRSVDALQYLPLEHHNLNTN